jgi:rubrerythrin
MSSKGWTVEKALQTGVTMEEGAYNLYSNASKMVKSSGSKQMLKELAQDELKHMEYFEKALKDPSKVVADAQTALKKTIKDLGVTDPLKEPELSPDATYQEVLLYAIKSEKSANTFYLSLSKEFSGNNIAKVWENFAQQEAGHKQKLEKEYDDVILADN